MKTLLPAIFLLPVGLIIFLAGCDEPGKSADNAAVLAKLDLMSGRLDVIEKRIEAMEAKHRKNGLDIVSLRGTLGKMKKDIGSPRATLAGKEGTAETTSNEGGNLSAREASELTEKNPDKLEKLKEEIKKEIKEEELAEELEAQKKWAEHYNKEMKTDFENKMKQFPKLAEKIGLALGDEEEIGEIAQRTFEKISAILMEAWSKPKDKVNWGEVKNQIDQEYQRAEEEISAFVTEEQGKALREFFEIGK